MPSTALRCTIPFWEMKISSWPSRTTRAGEAPFLAVSLTVNTSLRTTALDRVVHQRRPLAVPVLGDDEEVALRIGVVDDVEGEDAVALVRDVHAP
jgi:hypothetical protein